MRIPDHYVRVIELPPGINGVSVPNDDGTFSIYINALYDAGTQRRALEHELEHLARDHFYKAESVALQEAEADGKPLPTALPVSETPRLSYADLRSLERYLRSVGALGTPIEDLGEPIH
jgi:hypothetical protein